jgi:hypothetical protein
MDFSVILKLNRAFQRLKLAAAELKKVMLAKT